MLRNLLDNSDFRNPVNQSGQASYTGAVYGVDRWTGANSATTVSVEDGYIRITKNSCSTNAQAMQLLKQYIVINASNRGKTVTLAALYEGEYIIDMLPGYRSKGYSEELAECQRYYQIVKDGFGSIQSNGTTACLSSPLCTPMRSTDVSLAYMYVPAIRSNGKAFSAADATGEVAEYAANSSAVKVNLIGTFAGAENHVAYADGIFHLCADIL